ncbi:single-pass membrane and coiled-coil domain-containing protein 4 [Sipha flava]|jgi:fumarate reductase subunit C|uniref:Single-pass membrane and coiled-coil domain-containing protein 4 homolog n=1 Tax=Sipha flava TaxID=143950 RepID=A0A8B8FRI4_9HEMI|nr:single-pass membrane and coiled-coil domain-containing protein 4 [Sipha flava]XP_025412964.1 single-pass membrane and coiled-coil domain-containing protein 4 [Sipha flava]XP_025412965.1 single-pass membrane and coiled-coil domain-containing protein 4 [Sipha flava]
MRNSRTNKPKETSKQKKERKREFLENKKNVVSVVLPTLTVIFALITLFIYLKVHPNALNFMASEKPL